MNENNRIRPDVPLTDADGERVEERRMARADLPDNVSRTSPVVLGVAALAVLAAGIYFWPRDVANTNVTEKSPRVERPNVATTPPANKPTPTPPIEAPK